MWRDRFEIKECKVVLRVIPRQLVAELSRRNISVRRLRAEFGEFGFFTTLVLKKKRKLILNDNALMEDYKVDSL